MQKTEQHKFYIVALYYGTDGEFHGYSTGQRNGTAKTIPRAKQYKCRKDAEYRAKQYCQKTKIIEVTANYSYNLEE